MMLNYDKALHQIVVHNVNSVLPCGSCPYKMPLRGEPEVLGSTLTTIGYKESKDSNTFIGATLCTCPKNELDKCSLNILNSKDTSYVLREPNFLIKTLDEPIPIPYMVWGTWADCTNLTLSQFLDSFYLELDKKYRLESLYHTYRPKDLGDVLENKFIEYHNPQDVKLLSGILPLTQDNLRDFLDAYTNKPVEVTKEIEVESSHALINYRGDCKRLHGHSYKISVTVSGLRDQSGFVLDFKLLKEFLVSRVEALTDHRFLNSTLPLGNTTAENMSVFFFYLAKEFLDIKLPDRDDLVIKSIKIWETSKSFAEFKGL